MLKKGTTDDDVVVCSAGETPTGWAGYENGAPYAKPLTMDTIYVVNDRIPVVNIKGGLIRATLATSQTITKGDALICGAGGLVTAAAVMSATGLAATGSATASAVDATRPTVAVTVIGSIPAGGRIIGYAAQSVTTTSATAAILVRSEI